MKLKIQNLIWPTQNDGPFFLQKSIDFGINQGTLFFWIADSKNKTINPEFNMANTKRGTFFQKSMDCTKNQGTLVSWIADTKNETKNPKLDMVHTKWRPFFSKIKWITLKIEVFQFSGSLILEMNYIFLKLTWLTQSGGHFV